MNLLAHKNTSLFCAVINFLFAGNALVNGSLFWALLCAGLGAYCFNNWRTAP